MTADEKFNLITRNIEEILTEEELKSLIEKGTPLKHYIGFEISGKVHLGTGLACMQIVKNLHDAGVDVTIFLADWHSWINNKLDGTLETANKLARSYFEEGLKAGYLCVGGNPDDVKFILGSELYEQNANSYWATVIKVSKATTISRMLRSTDIMGRVAGESSNAASLIYPAMQAADIYFLDVNIAHAGTDQRNVHVVARDVAKDLGEQKPIAIHHHLLQGLLEPVFREDENGKKVLDSLAAKMSKSKPDSAVFIHDSEDEIRGKVNAAYCPEGVAEYNPILDWVKHLVFAGGDSLVINRKEEHGGDASYSAYEDLEKDFVEKKLHPQDLKNAVAEWLIKKLEPARKYFEDLKRKTSLDEIERLTNKKQD